MTAVTSFTPQSHVSQEQAVAITNLPQRPDGTISPIHICCKRPCSRHLYEMYTPSSLEAVPERTTHVREGTMPFHSSWDAVARPSGEQLTVSGRIGPRLPHYCYVMTSVNHQPSVFAVSSRLTCKIRVLTVVMALNQ